MIETFRLPDLGEGLTESELVQWHVNVGDTVELNQPLAEVETAKAIVELPSPFAGVVSVLHAEPGEMIEVGANLVSFETVTDAAARPQTETASDAGAISLTDAEAGPQAREPVPAAPAARQPNLVGYGAPATVGTHPVRRRRAAARGVQPDTPSAGGTPGTPRTSSAPDAPGTPGAQSETPPRTTRIPIRGVRKQTAAAMVASAFTAPHASAWLTIDVTGATTLLRSLGDDPALAGHRIGLLALTAKAVCLALARTPNLNATWDEPGGEIVQHHYVNLGIAVATDRGLLVPNIKDAERMPLPELSDALGALASTARSGHTQPAALSGGTFTITNFGALGLEGGTPILNPGESGILGLGAVRRQPWEHQGEIALQDVLTLSLSFDHRLVDGDQAATFLRDVAGVLGEPARVMLMV